MTWWRRGNRILNLSIDLDSITIYVVSKTETFQGEARCLQILLTPKTRRDYRKDIYLQTDVFKQKNSLSHEPIVLWLAY